MKKSYAKFIISAIMLVGGGNAFAQKWTTDAMNRLPREDMLRYHSILDKTPTRIKMDTIKKYRYNNLYDMLNKVLKIEDTTCAGKIKRLDAKIERLKNHPNSSPDADKWWFDPYTEIREAEEEKKEVQEYHQNTKLRYINDAFVRCMIESDRIHKKR